MEHSVSRVNLWKPSCDSLYKGLDPMFGAVPNKTRRKSRFGYLLAYVVEQQESLGIPYEGLPAERDDVLTYLKQSPHIQPFGREHWCPAEHGLEDTAAN